MLQIINKFIQNLIFLLLSSPSMILAFGAIIIFFVICAKLMISRNQKLKNNSKWINLTDYSTSDKIFRIVQYASLFVSGSMENHSLCQNFHYTTLLHSLHRKEFESLTLMMSRSRKLIRFIRAPLLILSIKNRKITINFSSKIQSLITIDQISKLFSDLSDVIFFLTDHYGFFHWLGLAGDPGMVKNLTTVGDIMWISCSVFFFISIFCIVLRNYLILKNKRDMIEERQVKIALMDFFSHCNEIVLGFCFLNPGLLRKQVIALMALASTVMRLLKFKVK